MSTSSKRVMFYDKAMSMFNWCIDGETYTRDGADKKVVEAQNSYNARNPHKNGECREFNLLENSGRMSD